MEDIDRYYEILGLEPGASPEDVKRAYLDLVQVWHPDRFYFNPRLQRMAQEKLREINEVYEELCSGRTGGRARAPRRYAKRYVGKQRRERFRVVYPMRLRPKLVVGEDEYDVLDVSEKGIRIRNDGGARFEETVHAEVRFHDGESLDIRGQVIRLRDDEVVFRLTRGIPYKRIIKEQRRLINELWFYNLGRDR